MSGRPLEGNVGSRSAYVGMLLVDQKYQESVPPPAPAHLPMMDGICLLLY